MVLLNIAVNMIYTEGMTYQENLLPIHQKKLGYDVHILTSQYEYSPEGIPRKADRQAYTDANGIHIKRLPVRGDKSLDQKLKRIVNLYQEIEIIKPDIIFCHSFQFLDFLQVVKYAKRHPEVKLFVDSHADFGNSARSFMSREILHKMLWKWVGRRGLRYVRKYFGVTPARVDFLRQVYGLPVDKTELLVMGADTDLVKSTQTEEVREAVRAAYGIKSDQRVILAGGKIDYNKPEIITLMEAFTKNAQQSDRLLVFGSVAQEYKEKFQNVLDGSPAITYIGWQNKEQIYRLFSGADLVVFPGLHSVMWEEAVGCGKPCIFRRLEGFTHIDLGGNCLFFEDLSEGGLWNTLAEATPQKLEHMGAIARKKGMAYFSYLGIAKKSIED